MKKGYYRFLKWIEDKKQVPNQMIEWSLLERSDNFGIPNKLKKSPVAIRLDMFDLTLRCKKSGSGMLSNWTYRFFNRILFYIMIFFQWVQEVLLFKGVLYGTI